MIGQSSTSNQAHDALPIASPSTTFMHHTPSQFGFAAPPQPIGIPAVNFLEPSYSPPRNATRTVTCVPLSNPLFIPQAGFSVGAMRPAQPFPGGVVPVPMNKVASAGSWHGSISWLDFED
jgi:hypothetical protein